MIALTFKQIAVLGFGAYMFYSAGYEKGRTLGRLEAQVYPQFNQKSDAGE